MEQQDRSSRSNPHQVQVTHLDWSVKINFINRCLEAIATYTLKIIDSDCTTLDLDTSHLTIEAITDAGTNKSLKYQLGRVDPSKPHLGQKLQISLNEETTKVAIQYRTTRQSSALQWLAGPQTAGKTYPYLFTQCQAIHARSLVPCQDRPGVKMTYNASVSVPAWATCVMSALLHREESAVAQLKDETCHEKLFEFQQHVPISSYLLCMAVGHLEKRELSERCAVWSEPCLVDSAAYEFADTEVFLKTAESIAGMPYAWGRYDLLCLPPSFPYGGMENPCLTFVTPTLLAGDRSLANVVAHEIAHSWTGNLVTNATWEHFWLNEGWTKWLERKIMSRQCSNEDMVQQTFDFDALAGYGSLEETVQQMPVDYTKLVLPIGDQDPDEAYSLVAYEKGFTFLVDLERRVGSEAFEAFFQAYVSRYAYKTLTSDDFKEFFTSQFAGNPAIDDVDWDVWFYEPGMPPETPIYDRTLAKDSERLAECWVAVDRRGRMLPTTPITSWSTNQITCFLDTVLAATTAKGEQPLKASTLQAMNKQYGFADSKNSEILFRYCLLAIAGEDERILPVVVRFVTSQGRMKFVRPLYRALYTSRMGKELAVSVFLENKDFYHPICAKMIASDLCVEKRKRVWTAAVPALWAMAAAAVVGAVGFVLLRRKR